MLVFKKRRRVISMVKSRPRDPNRFLTAGKGFVSLLDLFEVFFGFRLVGVAIRMKFHGQQPIGLFYLSLGCISLNPEDLIGIADEIGHRFASCVIRRT